MACHWGLLSPARKAKGTVPTGQAEDPRGGSWHVALGMVSLTVVSL